MECIAPILTTSRLTLRPLVDADLPALVEGLNDREVSRWLRTVPHPYGHADAMAFSRIVHEGRREGSLDDFVITITETQRVVGGIGLRYSEDRTTAALGYWIGRAHWGKGFATEASRRVVAYAREERSAVSPLALLEAHAHVGNERSRRVLANCGFTEVRIEMVEVCGLDGNRQAHRYELCVR